MDAVRAFIAENTDGRQADFVPIPQSVYPAVLPTPTTGTVLYGLATVLANSDLQSVIRALANRNSPVAKGYYSSKDAGYAGLKAEIARWSSRCSGDIVLMGYSQGAHIVGDMTQTIYKGELPFMPPSRLAYSLLVADPAFNPNSIGSFGTFAENHWGLMGRRDAYPQAAHGPVLSLCNADDIICNGGESWNVVRSILVASHGLESASALTDDAVVAIRGIEVHTNYDT
jgi:hypothetical protein